LDGGETTFPSAWYHKNIMSEFNGQYLRAFMTAKAQRLRPGGVSLHNMMLPARPDGPPFFEGASKR